MATQKRLTATKISDPVAHFSTWKYSIEPYHYELLGVGYRQFMKDKKPYWSWAAAENDEPQIEFGSMFYLRSRSNEFAQVVGDWDAFHIEIHLGIVGVEESRRAFAMTPKEFEQLLISGHPAARAKRLDRANSKAGLLAWQISESPLLLD